MAQVQTLTSSGASPASSATSSSLRISARTSGACSCTAAVISWCWLVIRVCSLRIDEICQAAHSFRLLAGEDVPVLLQRERDRCMAESLRDQMRANASLQEQRRVRVSGVVEADPR